ncbi:MAG: hypothetical protein HWN66_06135 [Candidatus Helarchaeota archaeon]|nr:hypothetical protein [Candidatus Helarchaeota archaeon]
MNAEKTKLELTRRQKKQAELALKSQIRIAKSILKGHQPLNTYHFQKAIEEIKQFRNLSRKGKQSFKDLDLLVSTTYLDSKIVKEIASQFKFKVEHAKEFIESKYTVKNFETMNVEEMANLVFPIHNRWNMKILPPITLEDVKRGIKYLNEKRANLKTTEGYEPELQKVEDIELEDSNLFSDYLVELYEEVKRIAGNRRKIQWEEIVRPVLSLGEKSRIAQGLSHLSYQNKLWLVSKNKGDYFQIKE